MGVPNRFKGENKFASCLIGLRTRWGNVHVYESTLSCHRRRPFVIKNYKDRLRSKQIKNNNYLQVVQQSNGGRFVSRNFSHKYISNSQVLFRSTNIYAIFTYFSDPKTVCKNLFFRCRCFGRWSKSVEEDRAAKAISSESKYKYFVSQFVFKT